MKIVPLLRITRAWNGVLVFASVFLGALFAGVLSPPIRVILACFSASLIASGGYSINDYFDCRTDLINKPSRPIPRGELRGSEVIFLSIFLTATGIIIANLISGLLGFVSIGAAVLLFLYSYSLKRVVLVGNLVVSFLCGLVFLYGGMSVGKTAPTLIPAIFSFLFHLGREILKDIEDIEGDKKSGASTVPIRLGLRMATLFSTLIYLALIVLTPIPYLMGIYNLRYLIAVIVIIDLPLILLLLYCWRPNANYGLVNRLLKFIMPLGLLSLYLGK